MRALYEQSSAPLLKWGRLYKVRETSLPIFATKIKLITMVLISNEVSGCTVRYLLPPGDHWDRKSIPGGKNKSQQTAHAHSAMCLRLRNLLMVTFPSGWGTHMPKSSLWFTVMTLDRLKSSYTSLSPLTVTQNLNLMLRWRCFLDKTLKAIFSLYILKICSLNLLGNWPSFPYPFI